MFEKVAWAGLEEEQFRIHQEKEVPIIDSLIAAIKDKLINSSVLTKSKYKEALGYFCALIPHLKNYTQHLWARMDNKVAERAVHPIALSRKNWLFVGGGTTPPKNPKIKPSTNSITLPSLLLCKESRCYVF